LACIRHPYRPYARGAIPALASRDGIAPGLAESPQQDSCTYAGSAGVVRSRSRRMIDRCDPSSVQIHSNALFVTVLPLRVRVCSGSLSVYSISSTSGTYTDVYESHSEYAAHSSAMAKSNPWAGVTVSTNVLPVLP